MRISRRNSLKWLVSFNGLGYVFSWVSNGLLPGAGSIHRWFIPWSGFIPWSRSFSGTRGADGLCLLIGRRIPVALFVNMNRFGGGGHLGPAVLHRVLIALFVS
jgi:hypothetical protein